jgi:inorganic pyrophosphatase
LSALSFFARAQPSPENIASAETPALKFDRPPHESLQALVTFGHVDQAYALIGDPHRIAEIRDFGT